MRTVICKLSRPWVKKLFRQGFPQRHHHLLKRVRAAGYAVEDFVIEPLPLPWLHLAYLLGMVRALFRFKKVNPSLVIADDVESALLAILVRRLFRVPFLFDFVDDYSLIIRHQHQGLRRALAEWVERTAPRIADKVIVVDSRKMEFCLNMQLGRGKVLLIPNGYDPALFAPGPRDEGLCRKFGIGRDKVALFAGKLNQYYNLRVIIDAIPRVLAELPGMKFLLVGEGDDTEALMARCRELKIEPNVVFTGPLPHEIVPAFIRLADICLFPLPDESALVLAEYMGCGKPVIVPRGGTEKMAVSAEVFPDACILRVENSPAGFAAGILHLASHDEAAARMGTLARERVSGAYSWDALAARYLNAIRDILPRNHPGRMPTASGGAGSDAFTTNPQPDKGESRHV